jgi:formylglycine-generating enzyme required for sulfatase activity
MLPRAFAALLLVTLVLPSRADPLTGMTFVRIPAGTFDMGTPDGEPGREPQERLHRVTLAKDFYLAAHEVTQAEWTRVMRVDPSHFTGCAACPVENVTYFDVQDFIRRLNAASSWRGFRLPTEAEWEYACRAGGREAYGASATLPKARANVNGTRTTPAGRYPANAFGLFDMSGNVWEWTADDHSPGLKVIRGGSWRFGADSARCGLRYTHRPRDRGYSLGVRLAHDVE